MSLVYESDMDAAVSNLSPAERESSSTALLIYQARMSLHVPGRLKAQWATILHLEGHCDCK